jgi:cold shock CspA family protein/ribosome-associated translation inhibitor RaiA
MREDVRCDDVYIVQPTGAPVGEHLPELLLLADACCRAGAERTTGVVRYWKQCRRFQPKGLAREMLSGGMQLPLQVSFRGMPRSAAIETDIREKAAKLEEFYDRITSVRVVVETPHRQHRQGKLFHVRIDVRVPGREIVVSREPAQHHAYEDVYVAIRDAFDAARRQIEDYAREMRGTVKTHEPLPEGRIVKLDREGGFGFIALPDARELYFHRNSVVDAEFDRLRVGDEVRFVEELGEEGPQASTVHVVGTPFTIKKGG